MYKEIAIQAIYESILDKYGCDTPFETTELSRLCEDFKKKYSSSTTQNKYDFETDLIDLIWGNCRNAFRVGFDVAISFMTDKVI